MNALFLCCVCVCLPTFFRLIRLLLCIHSSFIISCLPLTPHSPHRAPSSVNSFVLSRKDAAALSLFSILSSEFLSISAAFYLIMAHAHANRIRLNKYEWREEREPSCTVYTHTYTQTRLRTFSNRLKGNGTHILLVFVSFARLPLYDRMMSGVFELSVFGWALTRAHKTHNL